MAARFLLHLSSIGITLSHMKRECTITIRVSVEEREKLRLEAEDRDVSVGWLVREAISGRRSTQSAEDTLPLRSS